MYNRSLSLWLASALVLCLLSGCSTVSSTHQMPESENSNEASFNQTEVIENTDVQEETNSANESETVYNSEAEKSTLFEQNVLYKKDFEISDYRGTGYTNLVDFYNDYPNGKKGGTFANAGVMVHYRQDMDKDMSLQESLDFKTWRSIGLGSTLDEVFDAYGTVNVEPPFPEISGISDSQHTLMYYVDYLGKTAGGALVSIRFYFDQNDTVMMIDYGAVYAQYASNTTNIQEVIID